ncbi:hypothetical protein KCP70_12970 [Salmonella enterica subsp. enterica]|nr:hypothetical protein KCP70_12970 [Salmonella enterica subsp. enterica]
MSLIGAGRSGGTADKAFHHTRHATHQSQLASFMTSDQNVTRKNLRSLLRRWPPRSFATTSSSVGTMPNSLSILCTDMLGAAMWLAAAFKPENA